MGVTEYKGARYVPKFTDNPNSQWTNTVTYEPLTIVMHDGNSYTSRQFVPIGIDITNADYWAETGNYNAQVEAYRQEVHTFDTRITNNTTAIDTEKTERITTNNEINKTLNTIVPLDESPTQGSTKGATSGGIYAFGKNINSRKTFVLLGDSFGAGTHPLSSGGYGTSEYGWVNYLTTHHPLNATVYSNQSQIVPGNSGFTSTSTWLAQLTNMVANKDIPNPSEVTDIIVMGGTNDQSELASIHNAIGQFMDYVHNTFPYAQVTIGWMSSDMYLYSLVAWRYQEACTAYGAKYLYATGHLMANPNYISSDNTHLTEEGYQYYAPIIYEIVYCGRTTYTTNRDIMIQDSDINSEVIKSNTCGFSIKYTESGLHIIMRNPTDISWQMFQLSRNTFVSPTNIILVNNAYKYFISRPIEELKSFIIAAPVIVFNSGTTWNTGYTPIYFDENENLVCRPGWGSSDTVSTSTEQYIYTNYDDVFIPWSR